MTIKILAVLSILNLVSSYGVHYLSLATYFHSNWLFWFFQITTMILFGIALIYSNRMWVSGKSLGRWPASEFKKFGILLKGIQKALRLYRWHLAFCIIAMVWLGPIHFYVMELFMAELQNGFAPENSLKQFSGHWIIFNYFTVVFFVLIIPLQLKLANHQDNNLQPDDCHPRAGGDP